MRTNRPDCSATVRSSSRGRGGVRLAALGWCAVQSAQQASRVGVRDRQLLGEPAASHRLPFGSGAGDQSLPLHGVVGVRTSRAHRCEGWRRRLLAFRGRCFCGVAVLEALLQLPHQQVEGEDECDGWDRGDEAADRGGCTVGDVAGHGDAREDQQEQPGVCQAGRRSSTARRTDSEATTMKPSTISGQSHARSAVAPLSRARACRASYDMAKPASASPATPAVLTRWMRRRPTSAGVMGGDPAGRPVADLAVDTERSHGTLERPLRSSNDERHRRRSGALQGVALQGGNVLVMRRASVRFR